MARHSEKIRYMVCVLWLKGYSLGMISVFFGRAGWPVTVNQVWGIVMKSPYRKRSRMGINERQNHLDILKGNRLDEGALKEWAFIADPATTRGATRWD